VDLDALVADRSPEWIVRQAERFYVSLGLPTLPATFWERSDLYELPADSPRRKNTHASAWHIDLDQDVRSLMSVKPNFSWFTTAHHELGHVYYYLAYSNPGVPFVLRAGANRAFHEGIGTLIELASNQPPYLREAGLLPADRQIDQVQWLLSQALVGPVVFIPFACGTMTHFEHDLYEEDLPPSEWNARWWTYAALHQGLAPPGPRGADACDAATKSHINDDPAQYYDYAISNVILHQLHDHICRVILKCDPHQANYHGNREVGAYLRAILEPGATRDWRALIEEATGEPLSARAMLAYFAPLQAWLAEQNRGRDVGFD
jgi:peptidyl-dipeptidase A